MIAMSAFMRVRGFIFRAFRGYPCICCCVTPKQCRSAGKSNSSFQLEKNRTGHSISGSATAGMLAVP